MTDSLQTPRTTVRRLAKRADYDRDTVNAILDEAYICHVGFVIDGSPMVIPTIHWRDGETLYLHGSVGSRMLRTLKEGTAEACVTVTLLDALVLARSAFHHSMNYRSAVILGTAREVTDEGEKLRALDGLVEHVLRGRSHDARPANATELKQTSVIAIDIQEASTKIRTGGAVDDEEDYALDVWAGIVPLAITAGEPVADDRLKDGVPLPDYVRNANRRAKS